MYLYSHVSAGLLHVRSAQPLTEYDVLDAKGNQVHCPVLTVKQLDGECLSILDAALLLPWSVDNPVLYTLKTEAETIRFGHSSLQPMQNKSILLNGEPIYLRGYIRGIIAHDHPNMTGLSDYEAA